MAELNNTLLAIGAFDSFQPFLLFFFFSLFLLFFFSFQGKFQRDQHYTGIAPEEAGCSPIHLVKEIHYYC